MGRRATPSQPSTAARPLLDAQGRTDAEAYLQGALDGSIVAGKRLKALAEKMLPRFDAGYKEWHYDRDAATRPVEFIETFCRIPSGKLGAPFLLEPYERMIIELIFGFVDAGGMRQFRTALVEVARKNGKTSLIAAIELYMLTSDGEGAPQIYNVATAKSQAAIGFGAAWRMVRQSPELRRYVRKGIVPERQADGLICDKSMGYITPLSKQSDHLDGLDVHLGVIDELAAFTSRANYDLIRQGMGARQQPLLVSITTQGFVRENVWDAERDYAVRWLDGSIEDDAFLGILFEMDDRSEAFDEAMWPKANPGLGTVKTLQYMREQRDKALNDPSFLPTYLTKDLNLPANQASAFLTFEEAVNEEPFELDPSDFRYAIVGFDAADTVDLAAARALMMRPGDDHIYETGMYWIPEESVRLADGNDRRERDDVPYHEWASRDLMRIMPGNRVDKRVLLEWIKELYDKGIYTFAVGYDPWHMDDGTLRDLKAFVGEGRVLEVRQGPRTLTQPMRQIKSDLRLNRMVDGHNPVNEWCRMNTMAKVDINGNMQPVKAFGPKGRIDGFMAELDAYVVLDWLRNDYLQAIGW